jgi:hypothetical protein
MGGWSPAASQAVSIYLAPKSVAVTRYGGTATSPARFVCLISSRVSALRAIEGQATRCRPQAPCLERHQRTAVRSAPSGTRMPPCQPSELRRKTRTISAGIGDAPGEDRPTFAAISGEGMRAAKLSGVFPLSPDFTKWRVFFRIPYSASFFVIKDLP